MIVCDGCRKRVKIEDVHAFTVVLGKIGGDLYNGPYVAIYPQLVDEDYTGAKVKHACGEDCAGRVAAKMLKTIEEKK